jgi:hypothetical protein
VGAEDSDSAEVHWGDEVRPSGRSELLPFWMSFFLDLWMFEQASEWLEVEVVKYFWNYSDTAAAVNMAAARKSVLFAAMIS